MVRNSVKGFVDRIGELQQEVEHERKNTNFCAPEEHLMVKAEIKSYRNNDAGNDHHHAHQRNSQNKPILSSVDADVIFLQLVDMVLIIQEKLILVLVNSNSGDSFKTFFEGLDYWRACYSLKPSYFS